MEFLNNGMQSIVNFCIIFLVKNFAWSHTRNGRGHDVLPMLYPISIHYSQYFYSERILIAVAEVVTLLLFILI